MLEVSPADAAGPGFADSLCCVSLYPPTAAVGHGVTRLQICNFNKRCCRAVTAAVRTFPVSSHSIQQGREQSALSHRVCSKCKLNVQAWLPAERSQTVTCINLGCFHAVTNLQSPRTEWLCLPGRGRTQLLIFSLQIASSCCSQRTMLSLCPRLVLLGLDLLQLRAAACGCTGQPRYPQKLSRWKGCQGNVSVSNPSLGAGSAGGEDRRDLPQPSGHLEPGWWAALGPPPFAMSPRSSACQSCQAPAGTAGTRPGLFHANPSLEWDFGLFILLNTLQRFCIPSG